MVYATSEQVAEYMGMEAAELPDNTSTVIKRASEMIDYSTLDRINAENSEHLEAAKQAVCAQVEYWMTIDESFDIIGGMEHFSVASFSMKGNLKKLAPRAFRALFIAGLTHRRVGM